MAEVNLKLIWEVVSQIKIGQAGRAYVVDEGGRLIAHPDMSLVLRNTDVGSLEQVRAARAGSHVIQQDLRVVRDIEAHTVFLA